MAQLLFLDKTNRTQDINVYVNSPGGSVTAGLAIYDTMQFVPARRRDLLPRVRRPRWAPSCSPEAPRESVSHSPTPA